MNYYITEPGRLRRKDNSILFEGKDRKIRIPIEMTNSIYVFDKIDINSDMLSLLDKYGISISFFTERGHYYGQFNNRFEVQGKTLMNEVNAYQSDRHYVMSAILDSYFHNQRSVLHPKENRSRFKNEVEEMTKLEKLIDKTTNYQSILLIEAKIKKIYYICLSRLIENDDFKFETRSYHPPKDRINALISFVNSLIYAKMTQFLIEAGLSPSIGFLHETNERKDSLALDLAEIYKPVIGDRVILSLINNGKISASDFEEKSGGYYLTKNAIRTVISAFEDKLNDSVKIGNRKLKYQTIMSEDVLRLKRYFNEGKELTFHYCPRG